jgi:hypothetical protein
MRRSNIVHKVKSGSIVTFSRLDEEEVTTGLSRACFISISAFVWDGLQYWALLHPFSTKGQRD